MRGKSACHERRSCLFDSHCFHHYRHHWRLILMGKRVNEKSHSSFVMFLTVMTSLFRYAFSSLLLVLISFLFFPFKIQDALHFNEFQQWVRSRSEFVERTISGKLFLSKDDVNLEYSHTFKSHYLFPNDHQNDGKDYRDD